MSYLAHIVLQELHILPREFLELDPLSRRFIIASLHVKAEDQKAERKKNANR